MKTMQDINDKYTKIINMPIERFDFEGMLNGSITQSLIGVIPAPDMTLNEIRAERLKKYEGVD